MVRSLLVLVTMLAVCAIGAGTATATGAADATCEAFGGQVVLYELGYACTTGLGNPLSEGQLRAATAICEHAHGGTFIGPPEVVGGYFCVVGLGT